MNGTPQTGGHEIDVEPTDVATTTFDVGTLGGTDTLWARLLQNDGTLTSWQQFNISAPVARMPTLQVSNNVNIMRGQQIALSNLVSITDPDDVGYQQLELWDSNGTAAGGQFVVDGVPQTGGHEIDLAPSDLGTMFVKNGQAIDPYAWIEYSLDGSNTPASMVETQPANATPAQLVLMGVMVAPATVFNVGTLGGTDTLWARLLQGNGQLTSWQQFTVTAPIDRPPVVTVENTTAAHGQSFSASTLFTVSDPDGDAIAQYDFWDTGAGDGHFVLNNQPLGINQDNYVSASQLPQTTYQSGSGADTLWVRVSDGALWSAWSQSFTVTAPIDTGPVVVPVSTNISATHDQSFAVSSLFLASDPFGDAITEYDFYDTGTGGGHFLLNNQALGANKDNYVSATQLAQTTYQSGSGADTLWVRVSDGSEWSPWSQSFTMTAPVDTGPVVNSVTSILTTAGQTFAASALFTTSDPFGDAIEQYDFWDTGAGGGHFANNGRPLAANQDNIVSTSQLGQTGYVAGSGTDTLWVRVSEGGQWSPWSPSFTVSDPTTIGADETLELSSAYSGQLSFVADTGTLKLDSSASFEGTVAGMSGQDTIDFTDIDATKVQTPSYSGNASGGTLAVTDGTHAANIALLGNYLASTFVTSSDGHGGTNVVEHAASTDQTTILAQPQH